MAITYRSGSTSNPADNGTLSASPVTVTPVSGMQTGDLCLLVAHARGNSNTMAIVEAGGQTWNSLTASGSNSSRRVFWCRFNGTWSASPSVSFSTATCTTVAMHVFIPTAGSNTWGVDVAEANGTFAAPGSPYDVTITGITCAASSVALFIWGTADNNSWTLQTGGFSNAGTSQYRNVASTDGSHSTAYKLMPSGGATGNVTNRQVTVVGDAGNNYSISFKEISETITDKTITATSRIAKVVDATINAISRIAKVVDQTIPTKAAIAKVVDRTIPSLAKMIKVLDVTISAVANIYISAVDKTITAKGAIAKIIDRALTAISRIAKIVDQTITAVANIVISYDVTIAAKARMAKIIDSVLNSVGAVQKTTDRTISAVAKISGVILQTMKTLSMDSDMGLISQSIGWSGNMLPIAIVDDTPVAAPPGGKGFVVKVVGGVATAYIWDGAAWRNL